MATHTQGPKGGDTLLGQVLQGHYHILERVAKGGMAWIYRAEHTQLRNDMAIKILFPQLLEEPELCERFLEEARIQFGLKHPNIVQVTDVINEEGLVGIVLEWINGRDLRYWLREHRKPFTPAQLREVMLPIVDAVQYAHEKGIVHRDLKPGNILFHKEANRVTAKVADFGIAKLMDEVDSATKTGTMMGTLQYMSPEQIRDSKNVDHRADIYSLGVILFRMATGRLPFRDKNALTLMRKHEVAKPPIPSELNPSLPEEIDALILRCLEKSPDARFSTCKDLALAMQYLPETSMHSRSGLYPSFLIGQPADDDFGDPQQGTNHGVKRISFGASDELPTGSIAGGSSSAAAMGFGDISMHGSSPAHTPPPHKGSLRRDLNTESGPETFFEGPAPTPRRTNGAPNTPLPRKRQSLQTALDPELPERLRSFIEQNQDPDDPSQPLDLGHSSDALPQELSQPPKEKSRKWVLFLVLGLFLSTGIGGFVYWTQQRTLPKSAVRTEPVKAPPVRRVNMIDKLDDAVDSALQAIKMEKLVLAASKLKLAMSLKSKDKKRPAWQKSKYFPELFRVAGRVASGRGHLYTAKRYYEKYSSADMRGKSKVKIAKHRAKTARLKKDILPKIQAVLKTRVDKANTLLSNLDKGLKRNRFDRAFALYQSLRKTVYSVPSVYRKLASTLRNFFPTLSLSIYKNILDDMLPPAKLAAAIRLERDKLQKEIEARQQTIQESFAKASTMAKAGKYRKISRWLRKNYRNNQSFAIFHQQMVRLLMDVANRDFNRAQSILNTYMALFKRYTEKGLSRWAKTSKTPLALPSYDKLTKMRTMLRQWRRFSNTLKKVSRAIRKGAFYQASSQLRRLPKGWRGWIKEDEWGFHKYIALGTSLGSSHNVLRKALKRHKEHQKSLSKGYVDKAKAGYQALNQYLARNASLLIPLIGRSALKQWRTTISRQKKRSDKAKGMLDTHNRLFRRRLWKKSEGVLEAYVKYLPRTHLLRWAQKRIKQCKCNRNVPWVWCKGKKKPKR